MGQLLSNVSSLLMNDIDTAADKDRPKEKLETEFSSPAREYYLLPDPRSVTENVDRTPIYATRQSSAYKPETDTPRPRYLETDMDNVLGVKPMTERVCRLRLESSRQKLAMSEVVTSTPVARATPIDNITAISEQASQESLRFSDTGHCEVVTSENTDEIVIQDESVEDVSIINDELVENSTASNWSGIGGPDHSLGPIEEFSEQQYAFSSERDISITESLIVHKDSFDDVSAKMEEWDSPVTNDTNTPKMTKNAAPRTPLGDVSKNSLHVTTNKQSNKPHFGQLNKLGTPAALQGKLDEKTWRTAQDERIKICTGVENTPPRLNLATYPLDVVQSAPGRLNTKQGKKLNARWANDSLVV